MALLIGEPLVYLHCGTHTALRAHQMIPLVKCSVSIIDLGTQAHTYDSKCETYLTLHSGPLHGRAMYTAGIDSAMTPMRRDSHGTVSKNYIAIER